MRGLAELTFGSVPIAWAKTACQTQNGATARVRRVEPDGSRTTVGGDPGWVGRRRCPVDCRGGEVAGGGHGGSAVVVLGRPVSRHRHGMANQGRCVSSRLSVRGGTRGQPGFRWLVRTAEERDKRAAQRRAAGWEDARQDSEAPPAVAPQVSNAEIDTRSPAPRPSPPLRGAPPEGSRPHHRDISTSPGGQSSGVQLSVFSDDDPRT